ncbi:Heat shock transcription factor, partial [Dimargaris cristalligena]
NNIGNSSCGSNNNGSSHPHHNNQRIVGNGHASTPSPSRFGAPDSEAPDLHKLLREIAAIRKHQLTITSDLKTLQESNNLLWQEAVAAESRHKQHQDIIEKVLRFLASLFSNQKRATQLTPRKRQLMIEDAPHTANGATAGPASPTLRKSLLRRNQQQQQQQQQQPPG